MAHPAKAAAAGADVHFEHRLDPLAQGQVGKADDAGGDPGLAVAAAGAHRREPGDEFGLADRAQFGRAVGAVHRAAFEKHGRFDVVTGIDVGEQLFEQIAMAGTFGRPIPEMMVRVDDRQIGVEDRLRRLRGEPSLVRPLDAPPPLGRLWRCRHAVPPCFRHDQDTAFATGAETEAARRPLLALPSSDRYGL